jgi:hypothetical protein
MRHGEAHNKFPAVNKCGEPLDEPARPQPAAGGVSVGLSDKNQISSSYIPIYILYFHLFYYLPDTK